MVYRCLLLFFISLLLPVIAFSSQEYVVKKGDNLYDLSRKFGVSTNDLKTANNLKNDKLSIGDVLLIPDSKNSNKKVTESNNNDYTVKSGDTLSAIADKHGISIQALKQANGLKNSNLQIGQRLRISTPGKPEDRAEALTDEGRAKETAAAPEVSLPEKNAPEKNAAEKKPDVSQTPKDKSYTQYKVKSGDTLGGIAQTYGVTSKTIKELNGLKDDRISLGQSLKVPAGEVKKSAALKEKPATKTLPSVYVVEKGDYPEKIAGKLGVNTKDLINLNDLNSRSLQIGQKLKVPGAEPAAPAEKASVVKSDEKTAQAEAETKAPEKDTPEKKAETASAPVSKTQDFYTVKKGDTPSGIAKKLGVPTKELITLNNLNSRSLQIGQKLKVPGSETRVSTNASAEQAASKPEQKKENNAETARKAKTSPEPPSEYTVKKGDSLIKISKKFNISVNDIKKKNNLKGSNLKIGQKLVLGSSKAPAAQSKTARTEAPAKKTGKYTVKKGDTIGHIALTYGISQKELKSENGLRGNTLRIGQVLKIPGLAQKQDTQKTASAETTKTTVVKTEPEPVKKAYVKKRYVVRGGDTLSGIATHFGVSAQEIKKASALKNDRINKGDVLLIPVPHDYVATPKRNAGAENYTVVTGDTLGGIGSKFGVTVSDLKEANGLTNNELWVGMKLKIPATTSAAALKTRAAPKTTKTRTETKYTVKRGDTLGVIAKRNGVTLAELKRTNNLRGSTIRVGQSLTIPGSAHGTAKYANSYNTQASSKSKSPKLSIIKVAKKYLGAPYKFGGNSYKTGIDCSGYVKKVFSSFNVELPRTARDIYYSSGNKISKNQLDTGDLVFFTTYAKYPSHVGIYIGGNQFIHASSARKRVAIDSINKRYYRNRYIGAKRVQVSGLFYDELSKEYKGFEEK